VGLVPGGDLEAPPLEGSPERADFGRHVLVGHVGHELINEGQGELGIGAGVELTGRLLGVPGHPHLTVRVSSLEESGQLLVAAFVQSLVGLGEQPSGLEQRIAFPAAMSEQLLLDPSAALVELEGGVFDHVERIRHLDRMGDGGVEDGLVGGRQVQGGVADLAQPLLAPVLQPGLGLLRPSPLHDVEELATLDVHQLGRERRRPVGADPDEEDLVETEGLHVTEPVGIVDEDLAVGDDGVVHRVPVTTEVGGHLVDGPGMAADLFGGPACCPGREALPGSGDAVVGLGEGLDGALGGRADEAALAPHGPGRSSVDGEIDQFDVGRVLHPGDRATDRPPTADGR